MPVPETGPKDSGDRPKDFRIFGPRGFPAGEHPGEKVWKAVCPARPDSDPRRGGVAPPGTAVRYLGGPGYRHVIDVIPGLLAARYAAGERSDCREDVLVRFTTEYRAAPSQDRRQLRSSAIQGR